MGQAKRRGSREDRIAQSVCARRKKEESDLIEAAVARERAANGFIRRRSMLPFVMAGAALMASTHSSPLKEARHVE